MSSVVSASHLTGCPVVARDAVLRENPGLEEQSSEQTRTYSSTKLKTRLYNAILKGKEWELSEDYASYSMTPSTRDLSRVDPAALDPREIQELPSVASKVRRSINMAIDVSNEYTNIDLKTLKKADLVRLRRSAGGNFVTGRGCKDSRVQDVIQNKSKKYVR